MNPMNETHDPKLRSWLDSANSSETDFPIQNLPFGIFTRSGAVEISAQVGVAIGDSILDVTAAVTAGLLPATPGTVACRSSTLNALMALDVAERSALRSELSELLRAGSDLGAKGLAIRESILIPMNLAELHLPVAIGDYTDFYASIHHATNVGRMFRPDNPLLPNYKYVPVGYHGRASSVVVSGTSIRRPHGQIQNQSDPKPSFRPSERLDYEAEVGFFVGPGNNLGRPIGIQEVKQHVFGLCLVNDWSARDIQRWEYEPLGPFLAKTFGTTVSPWVVPMAALDPFRIPGPMQDPPVLDYLKYDKPWRLNMELEVLLQTSAMSKPEVISRTNFRNMYWNMAQQLAHQTVNGTNVQVGDLYASGTVSGDEPGTYGSMLELAWRGERPLTMQ